MRKKACILLTNGFEEAEAIIIVDILRRLEIPIDILSGQQSTHLTSYHDISLIADDLLKNRMDDIYDAIILPGGPQNSQSLSGNPQVIDFLKRHDEAGAWVCPICSTPAKVMDCHNLLKGRRYVCTGDLHLSVTDGIYIDEDVVLDGNLLTSRGLGVVFEFSFTLGNLLLKDQTPAINLAKHIDFVHWPV